MVPMRDGVRLATDIVRPSRLDGEKLARLPELGFPVNPAYQRFEAIEPAEPLLENAVVLVVQELGEDHLAARQRQPGAH